MTRGTLRRRISFFSSSARNRSSWFGSAAAGPSCRIAAPISTTKAASGAGMASDAGEHDGVSVLLKAVTWRALIVVIHAIGVAVWSGLTGAMMSFHSADAVWEGTRHGCIGEPDPEPHRSRWPRLIHKPSIRSRCRHGRLPTESADGHSGVGRQACAGTRGAVSMVVLIW